MLVVIDNLEEVIGCSGLGNLINRIIHFQGVFRGFQGVFRGFQGVFRGFQGVFRGFQGVFKDFHYKKP